MLTASSTEEIQNINSSINDNNSLLVQQDSEDVSDEDISEIEEFLAKDDIDPVDLKNKANKLIQLIKAKERDLLLAAQIGQSLLDANVSMQNQLKMLTEDQKTYSQSPNVIEDSNNSNNDDDQYGTSSNTKSSSSSSLRFDEPLPNSSSMIINNSGKKSSSRTDLNTYTDNLEEVNYELQNQVEKLEETLKQNEQQNSKRIVLLENLLDQLQNELSELQVMNRNLENEKRLLIKEKESSKKINEMSEKDTEKMIAQLYENKNKLSDTVNKLEKKKKILEDELLDAMNGGSMLQNEIEKWKQEAEDCNKYKELYEQELQRVSVLEASLNSYRDDIRLIKVAQMDLKSRSIGKLDMKVADIDFSQNQDSLNSKMKLSEELDDGEGESSHSRKIHRRRIIRRSNLNEASNIEEEEEEIEESEIIGRSKNSSGHHHHHHRHSHQRHIQPLSYNNENNDYVSVIPQNYSKEDNVVVLHGRISNIEDEDEEIDGSQCKEIVLRDKPCHKCGKIRVNRFNHQKNSCRSHSRVMRARAKRTAISKKRHTALIPLNSIGEEDEETSNSIIKYSRDNSGFMGIYNTCKEAIENLDYSKTDLTKSQSAWKFLQFWFAMLCIFIGCIVVSYRRVFQGNTPSKSTKKIVSK